MEPRAVRIVPNDPPAVITAADHMVKGVLVFEAEGRAIKTLIQSGKVNR